MENNNNLLFEETKKRLQTLLEYTVMPYSGMDEADDDQDQAPADAPQEDPNAMGDAGQAMPQASNIPQGGEQVPMSNPNGAIQGPEGFSPQPDAMQGPNAMDGDISNADFEGADIPSSDDNVVDITDLTDSQKETEKDIEKMDNKFSVLMKQLGAFEQLLHQNDEKIESLKAEFEKRNPTQIEKMSLHSAKGYPFDTPVEEYWKKKEKISNYSPDMDNNGKGQGQYVITKDDIDGTVDWKSIADSLDDDFMYNQTLDGVLKY